MAGKYLLVLCLAMVILMSQCLAGHDSDKHDSYSKHKPNQYPKSPSQDHKSYDKPSTGSKSSSKDKPSSDYGYSTPSGKSKKDCGEKGSASKYKPSSPYDKQSKETKTTPEYDHSNKLSGKKLLEDYQPKQMAAFPTDTSVKGKVQAKEQHASEDKKDGKKATKNVAPPAKKHSASPHKPPTGV